MDIRLFYCLVMSSLLIKYGKLDVWIQIIGIGWFLFLGEFHFCIHIVHGIYCLFSWLLLDMAAFLGWEKLKVDFLSKYFHKQEDFLLLVFESIHCWLEG